MLLLRYWASSSTALAHTRRKVIQKKKDLWVGIGHAFEPEFGYQAAASIRVLLIKIQRFQKM